MERRPVKTKFELDESSRQRIATVVFEGDDGQRFIVEAGPGEDVCDALHRFIDAQKQIVVRQVEILEPGKLYRVIFLNNEFEDFTAIL